MESGRCSTTLEDGKASILHQIDGSFLNKIMISGNTSTDLSNQVSKPIAVVPFSWESQPGIPRDDLQMKETVRPINLPPVVLGSHVSKPNITHTRSRVSMIKTMKKIQRGIKNRAKHLGAKVDRYVTRGTNNNTVHSKENQGSSRPINEFIENSQKNDIVLDYFSQNLSSISQTSSVLKESSGDMQLCKLPRLPKTKVRSTFDGMARRFAKLSLKKTS